MRRREWIIIACSNDGTWTLNKFAHFVDDIDGLNDAIDEAAKWQAGVKGHQPSKDPGETVTVTVVESQ